MILPLLRVGVRRFIVVCFMSRNLFTNSFDSNWFILLLYFSILRSRRSRKPGPEDPNASLKRTTIILIILILSFTTLVVLFTRVGRGIADKDPFLDPMANPNIRVGDAKIKSAWSSCILQLNFQAPVVLTLDSAIHQINHYPVEMCIRKANSIIHWREIYLMDSVLLLLNNCSQT